jgi:hypothetical protein
MPGLGKGFAVIVRTLRSLRGGSQPILVQASDSHFYVVKFPQNPQGSNLVFNEVAGSELYRACGLPAPQWKPLLITDEFIDSHPDCWFQGPDGLIRPKAGLCFGSRYLGESGRVYEVLPATWFDRISNRTDFWLAWIIDVDARHTDNRQAIFVERSNGAVRAVFVDQGSMFGGATGRENSHDVAPRYLDPRIYGKVGLNFRVNLPKIAQRVNRGLLWRTIESLPPAWKSESGLKNLRECMKSLTSAGELEATFDRLIVSHLPSDTKYERICTKSNGRNLCCSILRAGVRASVREPGPLAMRRCVASGTAR